MHCNETNTTDEKKWKDTFNDIKAFHHEELKSNQVIDNDVIDIPQETYKEAAPTDATDEIGVDDDIDDSDDDKTIRHRRKTPKYIIYLMMMMTMMPLKCRTHLIKDQVTRK